MHANTNKASRMLESTKNKCIGSNEFITEIIEAFRALLKNHYVSLLRAHVAPRAHNYRLVSQHVPAQ